MQKHSAYRLTYALNATGQLVDVDKVPVGNKCGCFCPACKEPLIAKNQGTKRMHHFAHQSGTECDYAIGQYAVKNHLLRLKSFDCDIVICACTIGRNKQKIRDAIMAYPDYCFITKSKSQSADLVRIDNFNCAIHIMSMIENHLIL